MINLQEPFLEKSLRYSSFLCAVILLLTWALPHVIALRNNVLGLGLISSISWCALRHTKWTSRDFLPAILLMMVPIWLCLHYFVMPTNPALQLYDLKGTWFRVIVGVAFAACFGRMTLAHPKMVIGFLLSLAALPIYSSALFFYDQMYFPQALVNFHEPFKSKIGAVYFVSWMTLLGFGILSNQLRSKTSAMSLNVRPVIWPSLAILALISSAINFLAYQALNGVILLIVSGVFFIALCVVNMITNPTSQLRFSYFAFWLAIAAIVFGCLGVYWKLDQQSGKKLAHLLIDAKVAVQIDGQNTWQRSSLTQAIADPVNEAGTTVNVSTYERISWLMKGLEYLVQNPLGQGYSHRAFQQLMVSEYPGSNVHMTHSGWLDFTLGVGLPGLMLTWLVFALIARKAYKEMKTSPWSRWSMVYLWMLGGVWFLWFPGELSEREYIEHLFFMLAFMSTSINPQPTPIS
jgi:hypothetical protein